MGYCSHVLFAITKPAEIEARLCDANIDSLLKSANEVYFKTRPIFVNEVQSNLVEQYSIYEWDSVKWYDSDEEVTALHKWMKKRRDTTPDIEECGFMFMRKGEDLQDLDHEGDWNFGIKYGIEVSDD